MHTFTVKHRTVTARAGQYVLCDCMGFFLRVEDAIFNGLGITYRVQSNGTLQRVYF